jgi:hypothetical protein
MKEVSQVLFVSAYASSVYGTEALTLVSVKFAVLWGVFRLSEAAFLAIITVSLYND